MDKTLVKNKILTAAEMVRIVTGKPDPEPRDYARCMALVRRGQVPHFFRAGTAYLFWEDDLQGLRF